MVATSRVGGGINPAMLCKSVLRCSRRFAAARDAVNRS
jgi:hypothetical protein